MPHTQRVREVIADRLDRQIEDTTLTAELEEDLGADSLDKADLQVTLVKEFDIDIPDESVVNWRTVQDVVETVNALKERKEWGL